MHRAQILAFSCLIALTSAVPVMAQSAAKVGQHNAWGVYSYDTKGGKVCYVLTVPTDKEPKGLDHGNVFFFISQRPGQNVSYEPQFIAGYDLQEKSKVTVTVGDKSFSMFTRGQSAWLENAAEEPQLIAGIKGGSEMAVAAKSKRGNDTKYTFSLKGVTAALQSIANCK
jgi:hypothetical protein